jgi:hypothetical protein
MIIEPGKERGRHLVDGAPRVSAAERRRRLGHGAAVLWVTGEGETEARARAEAIERGLFDAGVATIAVPANGAVARACAKAGLVTIVAVDASRAGEAQRPPLREELRSAGILLIDVSGERDPVESALEALAAADVV